MKRAIKFRVWDKHVKHMFTWEKLNAFDTEPGSIKRWFTDGDSIHMQFTGFKDTNGKDIYEGDIIDYADAGNLLHSGYYVVEYRRAGFYPLIDIAAPNGVDWPETWAIDKTVTVLGNIYQNPKLLNKLKEQELWTTNATLRRYS